MDVLTFRPRSKGLSPREERRIRGSLERAARETHRALSYNVQFFNMEKVRKPSKRSKKG